jgi:hypothetical protein
VTYTHSVRTGNRIQHVEFDPNWLERE